MHTVWAWLSQFPLLGIAPQPSTVEWGLAVGSVATLVALPRIARVKRSFLRRKSSENKTILQDRPLAQSEDEASVALSAIPERIVQLFEDPSALNVALPALLLFRSHHRNLLDSTLHPQRAEAIRTLWRLLEGIPPRARVALIDKAIQTLTKSPPRQAKPVLQSLEQLSEAAAETDWQIQAWCHLARNAVASPQRAKKVRFPELTKLLREMIELVSVAAVVAEDGSLTEYRFHRGWSYLDLPHATVLPAELLAFSDLESALAKASRTPTKIRARICNACTIALTTDGSIDETQAAMIRLIRQRLGHPPLLVLPGNVRCG